MSRRKPIAFLKAVDAYLKPYGDSEFDRDDPIAGVVKIIKQFGLEDTIMEDQARDIVERRYRADEAPGLFDLDRTIALGDRGRIKRRGCQQDHLARRKTTIDKNQISQNRAWAEETEWIAAMQAELSTRPPGTTVGDL